IDERLTLDARRLMLKIYPNPAKSAMRIRYSLPIESKVSLQLYDISGRLIKTLVNEEKKPGNYSLTFNTKTLGSCPLRAGVYFLSLQTEKKRIIERLVVVK
ncbi:MAG: T9SS type A sorting domain-containing protein, partial [candidate division WOR-3 bacterium]